jgi:Tol biopolymer transport system component
MIVFREFGPLLGTGLRILNLTDMSITNLTDTWDNTPGWSPDGSKIVFTRRNHLDLSDLPLSLANTDSYDIYTIFPDGTVRPCLLPSF